MEPTPRMIIEHIIRSIDEIIAPHITDQQAVSSLRAARTLLDHLARRVDVEADFLAADNEDAAQTLTSIGLNAEGTVWARAIAAAHETEDGVATNIGALRSSNQNFQRVIEEIFGLLPPSGSELAPAAQARFELRGYLGRRLARERDMIFPAFLGPPF